MRLALAEARLAPEHGDVPVGAVVVHGEAVIGSGHNERERRQDPTAHAETIALRQAAAHWAAGACSTRSSTSRSSPAPCAPARSSSPAYRASSTAPPTRRPALPAACSTSSRSRASTTARRSPEAARARVRAAAGRLLRRTASGRRRTTGGRRALGSLACFAAPRARPRRGAGVVERGGLENRCGPFGPPRVRIPPPPPHSPRSGTGSGLAAIRGVRPADQREPGRAVKSGVRAAVHSPRIPPGVWSTRSAGSGQPDLLGRRAEAVAAVKARRPDPERSERG